jgi:hypothetical protein
MKTPDFQPGGHVMYSEARAEQVLQVTYSMHMISKHTSDQVAVWSSIAGKSARLKSVSSTGAMSDIYRLHASSIDKFVRAFSWNEHQRGAAFGIAGRIVGIDILDCPNTMKRLFAKLIRSSALDALDNPLDVSDFAKSEDLDTFMAKITQARTFSDKALGLGKDVRFDAMKITEAALWQTEGTYTFVAFVGQKAIQIVVASRRVLFRRLGRF